MITDRPPRPGRSPFRAFAASVLALIALLVLGPSSTLAHPLGNFTINRYDGVTFRSDGARIDHVLDMAEIPAFQERQRMDLDGDRAVSDDEAAAWAQTACRSTPSDLELRVDNRGLSLSPIAVGISFPAGQGGLSTLRLVCEYVATYNASVLPAPVSFRDDTYPGRLGWREIVVRGDGVTIVGAESFNEGVSERLTAYPEAQLAQPRAQAEAHFRVVVGGASAPTVPVPDAVPLGSPPSLIVAESSATPAVRSGVTDLPSEIAAVIHARDLTIPALVLSLLVAVAVGAVHAASPGHGKTLMAAYLVGTRGTIRHAVGLGLTVTVSHTVGVLALGGLVLFAGAVVPAERLFPVLGLVSGLVVTAIGVGLLGQRLRERRAQDAVHQHRAVARDLSHAHSGHHAHAHDDGGDRHDHAHEHHHEANDTSHQEADGWHSHGLVRHTHLPQDGDPLRARNLFALGLVGGLVPSASAVLILVGSIAAGRPAYGMVLTLAFGFGMAVVLVGVGVLLVRARSLVERWPRGDRLLPFMARLPLVTAVIFVALGGVITVQAGAQFL